MKIAKGLVQIYTGNGKGKTTAALGLALRAAGAGLRVYIMQFIKGRHYSEAAPLKKIKNITFRQCGRGCFIKKKAARKDKISAQRGLREAARAVYSGRYDVVILDEICIALKLGLVKDGGIREIIKCKPAGVELVLTGRYSSGELVKCADLVTEMKEIKHPYKKGVKARRGIEY